MSRLLTVSRRVGNVARNTLAMVGFGTTFYALQQYNEYQTVTGLSKSNGHDGGDDPSNKICKKVLVLPFSKLKIVERQSSKGLRDILRGVSTTNNDSNDNMQEIELNQLIDIIHEAAHDKDINALYGIFGHGFRFECGGYAHVEEIRNAIKVFNESHRRHSNSLAYSSNTRDDNDDDHYDDSGGIGGRDCENKPSASPKQKYSYAFADTFDHPTDSGNKEYFLASAFSTVQLQPRGNLNLFGVATSNTFYLGALEKYGVKAHVFKHGKYKNAPNSLTENGYTREHLENTKAIIASINNTIFSSIAQSRNLHDTFNQKVWQAVHDYGTITALNAQEIKLVDQLPRIDPLHDIVALNRYYERNKSNNINRDTTLDNNKSNKHAMLTKERYEYLKKSWTWYLTQQPFEGNEVVSLQSYATTLSKRNKWKRRQNLWKEIMKKASEKSSAASALLSLIGFNEPHFNIPKNEFDKHQDTKEKIAIVHITGGIDDAMARKVTHSLRKIKHDKYTKAVIFRIDSPGGSVTASETILEECKDLQKPVICSFANVAASGGYYISSHANRIFALPTTLTGSIGVFGIKFDATELARSYGVQVNFVSSGKHASSYDIFHPLTRPMRGNFERNTDTVYSYFKKIVAEGRKLPIEDVERLARGRVWTGEQAKENGLVDEIGGIGRAILYAKKEFTTHGAAKVETWPKPLSMKDKILSLSKTEVQSFVADDPILECGSNFVQIILGGKLQPLDVLDRLSKSSCGIQLTMDESLAVEQTLKDVLGISK